jgi:hypothetical protein
MLVGLNSPVIVKKDLSAVAEAIKREFRSTNNYKTMFKNVCLKPKVFLFAESNSPLERG